MESKLETRHAIPTSLQILLSDLDFLSQIKRNTKPCSDRVLVDATSWTGAFYRFFKGENRSNVISKIEQIINQTVDAIETHKNTDHIKIIVNYLSNAKDGISSLITTYKDDPDVKARVNVILDIIDLQLARFRHLIKGFRPEEPVNKNQIKDQIKDEEFPGLNSHIPKPPPPPNVSTQESADIFDSSADEKRKLRKHRLRKSFEKE